MIDIAQALADLVNDFEESLELLRAEAEAAAEEHEPQQDSALQPLTFGSSYDDPADEFWPPKIVRPANELRPPVQIKVDDAGLDEDEVFRWQRWRG